VNRSPNGPLTSHPVQPKIRQSHRVDYKIAELPSERIAKFEFVANIKTAMAIGVSLPATTSWSNGGKLLQCMSLLVAPLRYADPSRRCLFTKEDRKCPAHHQSDAFYDTTGGKDRLGSNTK
jgi:hypothetical protein